MKTAILAATALAGAIALAGAAPSGASSFTEYQRLTAELKHKEAADVLRAEIASPSFVHSAGVQPVYIRQHLLLALGNLAHHTGVTRELDAEALKIYEEGMQKFARDDGERQAFMHNGMTLYYTKTYRNGLALPYARKELEHWQRAGNKFRIVLATDAISIAYWDMGEWDLGRLYQDKVLAVAGEYFVLGQRPSDINEWMQYSTILTRYMDSAAQSGDAARLDRLWKLAEPIEPRYVGTALGWYTAAQHQAMVGRIDEARATLAKAGELWKQAPARFRSVPRIAQLVETGAVCAEGSVDSAARQYGAAVKNLEHCLAGMTRLNLRENELNFYLRLARSHEGVGNNDRAIAAYRDSIAASETARGSFTVAERASFFRNFPRLSYWGLTRMQARRAAAGDEAAFFEAISTSELVRGRQLGELIDPDMANRVSPASMKELQQRLPADTVVLAYTATDDEIVLLAMTRDTTLASVAPYDARRFGAQVRATAGALARPESSPAQLNARLLEISKPVLAPARALLAGRKHIIALPDGIMNTIPFELFSAADEAYRPLLDDYVVSASPSLVFIQHAERKRQASAATNLMALADPKYAKPKAAGAAAMEDVQATTRGSRYLEYFLPLPETRTEAAAISRMFEGQTVSLLAGEDALESRVKSLDLMSFGFLHFATHGILGGEVPGLGEPALVLGEEPGEDGFLTASEVQRLRLGAELTVLSACNTGSGEFVTGEGVMGMSRAFLAAGSRAVVVSLWPVASRQTEQLMVLFYGELRSGRPAADALRAAKLKMIEQARRAGGVETHPFFWAPFILLGG